MESPYRILVPASFSVRSDAALDYATALARRVGATIDLLYVRRTRPGERVAYFADSDEGIAMERALSFGQRANVEVRGRVESGDLSEAITRVAETDRFDLIVMARPSSARGHRDTVARKVALTVQCPVVTVDPTMAPDDAARATLPR
jgi:nucleotide-binding universal stress UspA family protein